MKAKYEYKFGYWERIESGSFRPSLDVEQMDGWEIVSAVPVQSSTHIGSILLFITWKRHNGN